MHSLLTVQYYYIYYYTASKQRTRLRYIRGSLLPYGCHAHAGSHDGIILANNAMNIETMSKIKPSVRGIEIPF